MEGALHDLLRHPALWRARDTVHDASGAPAPVATGFAPLDRCLPGGGWPRGAMVEILHGVSGIGEMSLLLPALARLAGGGGWLAWITPPCEIAAPALQAWGVDPARVLVVRGCSAHEALWAGEQALRSGACGAVLMWPPRRFDALRHVRRLQLAAQAGGATGVLFRHARDAAGASPAALRLRLAPHARGLEVEILKSRGGRHVTVRVDPGLASPPGGAAP